MKLSIDIKKIKDFYPPIEPFQTGSLKVSDIHSIYYEVCGNPKGKPVVFLHGGPGAGCGPDHRRFFDPNKYCVYLFDQRGCGRSTPHAELNDNNTWSLVEDIEKLRKHFNVSKWMVFGGSWGSTLALSYAITYPESISEMILRGIFLCRPSEIKWFYQFGASEVFPDFWETYRDHIPKEEQNDFVKAYYKRLTDDDPNIRVETAKIWSKWESATSYLFVKPSAIEEYDDALKALAFARIECHYFVNNSFFKTDNYLIENIDKARHIPTIIVQGRYDLVCPIRSAWDLHRAWPEAQLNIIPDAGHSASEPGIHSALIQATDYLV